MEQKCTVLNCNNKILAKGLCLKHYKQQYRNGKISKRTIYDKNEFIIKDGVCTIICFNKNGEILAKAIIDEVDYEKVKDKKWSYLKIGYLMCSNENLYLHRYIMQDYMKNNTQDTIDHINRNKLDNRKINLRILTKSENLINKGLQKNNTSGERGVRIRKLKNGDIRYEARLTYKGRELYLGRYNSLAEARKIVREARAKYFGKDIIYGE